jgi:putative transposase
MPTTVETQDLASCFASGFASENIQKTQDLVSLRSPSVPEIKNKFGPQSRNLASIVRGFKIGVTKHAKSSATNFSWQTRFHDHILRDTESLHKITEYIVNNPKNWKQDILHRPVTVETQHLASGFAPENSKKTQDLASLQYNNIQGSENR